MSGTEVDEYTEEALRDILTKWAVPDPALVGKLPRVTCQDCSKRQCQRHQKAKCDECGAYVSTSHIHLDYLGHAEVTRALIEIDPLWSWEPVAWTEHGEPMIGTRGQMSHMWAWLTVHGVRRLGVGSCEAGKPDVEKELVGDFLRNAGMRYGIGLSLWSKSEWEAAHVDADPPADQATVDRLTLALSHLEPDQLAAYTAWRQENDVPSLKRGVTVTQAAAIAAWVMDSAARPGVDQPTTPEGSEAGEEAPVVDHRASIDRPTPEPETAPAEDGMTELQSRKLHALLRSVRQATGPQRHVVLSELVGREITSASDLTAAEAKHCIDVLTAEEAAS